MIASNESLDSKLQGPETHPPLQAQELEQAKVRIELLVLEVVERDKKVADLVL